MGGGSKSKSSSVSGSAQRWAQPYAKAGASAVQSVFNQNQPGLQELTGQVRSVMPGMLGNLGASNAARSGAMNYTNDVLSGKFLNGNPHLNDIIGRAAGDIRNNVASIYSMGGRYGSEAHQGALANDIGAMSSGLRYQNYSDEMNRMGQAASAAQGMNSADINQLLATAGVGAELPYIGSNNLGNSLGALFGGGTQTSTDKGANPIWGAIGAGLGAAGSVFCDRRLKTEIKHVLTLDDGLPMYSFEYKADMGLPEGRFVGPMADEVAKYRPWAMGPEIDGHMTVDANLVAKV